MIELKCGTCGKMRMLSGDESGGKVVCPACGAIMPSPAWSEPVDVSRPRPLPPEIKPPAPIPEAHFPATLVFGSALVVCLLALVAAAIWGRGKQSLASQIIDLKKEAEQLVQGDDLPAAHTKYAQIEVIAGGTKSKDPAVRNLLEQIHRDDRHVQELLTLRQERQRARQALELKVQAEQLAIEGDLDGAYATYQRLEQFVARSGNNVLPAAVLEQAARDQARVFAKLTQEPEPPPGPPQPTTVAKAPIQPATRPVEPTTQPVRSQPTQATTRPAAPLAGTTAPTARQARPLMTARPATLPVRPMLAEPELSDHQIDQAIQKSAEFLLAQFKADQVFLEKKPNDTYAEGLNALCIYALLQAGQAIPDERLTPRSAAMRALMERMKQHLMMADRTAPNAPVTYARSFRVAALSVYNRPEDRKAMEDDVRWLVDAVSDGTYTYNEQNRRSGELAQPDPNPPIIPLPPRSWMPFVPMDIPAQPMMSGGRAYPNRDWSSVGAQPPSINWDNSNTQYGLFGVWCGAEAGVPVPPMYWLRAERHWLRTELPTGQWGYDARNPEPRYGMTVGGIASLFITHDRLDAASFGGAVGQESYSPALVAGLMWLDKGDNSIAVNAAPVQYVGYNLFGLSRAGAQSGFKHFGTHDWYRELAAKIIASQNQDGSWGDQGGPSNIIETAYATLFLCSGRWPVIMNKLWFNGFWNNRARELANLSKFASAELERPTRWQIASLKRDWRDWCDSPVLLIASHQALKFKDEEIQKLRAFVDAGGMIFTHADGGAMAFNDSIPGLVRKLFPGNSLATLPASHPIYSLHYKVQPRFELKGVSNGARLVLVHAPKDLSTAWQTRDASRRDMFEMGMNVFAYAAGKPAARDRIALDVLPEIAAQGVTEVTIARLKHAGDWNPEPSAWPRFERYLKAQTGWELTAVPMEIQQLAQQPPAMAHLTATSALSLSSEQAAVLKNYVERGGVLLIDACGGSSAFATSAAASLRKIFPIARFSSLPPGHPLLMASAPGMVELSKSAYRPYVEQKLGRAVPVVQVISAGRGMVIYSPLDLTEGLLGCPAWGILGFQPGYAQDFVRNIVVWTMQQSGRGRS